MKSRGCYETPGGALIMFAVRELEALTLDKNTLHYKQQRALEYAEMVYNGLWFTPLREALDAFFEKVSETDHRRNQAAALQRQHRAAQPQEPELALLARHRQLHHGRRYDQKDALGFINLIGLPDEGAGGAWRRKASREA